MRSDENIASLMQIQFISPQTSCIYLFFVKINLIIPAKLPLSTPWQKFFFTPILILLSHRWDGFLSTFNNLEALEHTNFIVPGSIL